MQDTSKLNKKKVLGERLARYKDENLLTLRQLADLLQVDEKTVRNAISDSRFSDDTERKIRKLLGISCDMSAERKLLESDETFDVFVKMALETLVDEDRMSAVSLAFAMLSGGCSTDSQNDRYAPLLDELEIIVHTSCLSDHTPEVTASIIALANNLDNLFAVNPNTSALCKEIAVSLKELEFIVSTKDRLEATQAAFDFLRKNWHVIDPYSVKSDCMRHISIILSHADASEKARKKFFYAIYNSYKELYNAGYKPPHMWFV